MINNRLAYRLVCLSTLFFLVTLAAAQTPATAPTTRPQGPERWEEAIARFEDRDRANPPPENAILFIGSSSIVGWKLGEYFPDLPTINRGFGGSQIEDSLHYARRIVLPYRPRTIVFYAGENDIAAGKSPERVAEDFKSLVKMVRAELPDTKIVYLGLKPSPSRWKMIDDFRKANRLIREHVATLDNVTFIDVEPHMLGEDGHPRPELYLKDQLHMTAAGYELWADLVRPHLE